MPGVSALDFGIAGSLNLLQEGDRHIRGQTTGNGNPILPGIVYAVILKIKGNRTAFPVFPSLGNRVFCLRVSGQ